MNEQNLNTNQAPITPSPVPQPIRPKILDLVKGVAKKMYENKKIFRLMIIILGALLLVTIAGLIFSAAKNRGQIKIAVSPTPQATLQALEKNEDENITKLKLLKEKIFNLDIYQKRLSPPSLNFDISF